MNDTKLMMLIGIGLVLTSAPLAFIGAELVIGKTITISLLRDNVLFSLLFVSVGTIVAAGSALILATETSARHMGKKYFANSHYTNWR